jgi:hypothetical protein
MASDAHVWQCNLQQALAEKSNELEQLRREKMELQTKLVKNVVSLVPSAAPHVPLVESRRLLH